MVADAFSRRTGGSVLAAFTEPTWHIWDEIRLHGRTCGYYMAIRGKIHESPESMTDYTGRDGIIMHKGRTVVPENCELRQQLLHHFHDSHLGGHSRVYRTWVRLNNNFCWTGMKGDVQKYVASCDTCQWVKSDSRRPGGLLQPLPIPNQVWEDISMDFIEGLPQSNGYDGILVVVDRLTKYAHFVPMVHPYTAKSVAHLVIGTVVKLHGIPQSIVTDRDRIFTSNFWKELFRLQGS